MNLTTGILAILGICVPIIGFAVPAFGQGVEIQPIGFDLDPDDDTELVIAALNIDTAATPILNIRAGGAPAAQLLPDALRPSIILGAIAPGDEARFDIERLLPATVEQYGFALDDLDARETLRQNNPEIFRRLVAEGHLDPPESDLIAVLQTEFARMNCYTSRIDGLWGGGSRRAITAYFGKLDGSSWQELEPSFDLFRAVLLGGNVTCDVPVAATRRPQQTSPSNPPAAQPQPAPPPPSNLRPRIGNNVGFTGLR